MDGRHPRVRTAFAASVVLALLAAPAASAKTRSLTLSAKPSCKKGKVVLKVTAKSGSKRLKGVSLEAQMLAFRFPPITKGKTDRKGRRTLRVTVPGGLEDSTYGVGVTGAKKGYKLTNRTSFTGSGLGWEMRVSGGRCSFQKLT
jgi:hypothetical protein